MVRYNSLVTNWVFDVIRTAGKLKTETFDSENIKSVTLTDGQTENIDGLFYCFHASWCNILFNSYIACALSFSSFNNSESVLLIYRIFECLWEFAM